MKTPYRISQAASHVYRAGISYHAHGVVKAGKTAMFDFFQCDKVTPDQIAKLREYCPDMHFVGVQHRHAPEIERVQLMFPKAAFYRQQPVTR
jgi:hypothetical protein